jgi:hypothetical protein
MLEVLDTAGQEEYTALRDQWIRDGEGFVLVYSIASRSSFTRIQRFHNQIQRVKESSASSPSYPGSPLSASAPNSPVPIMCRVRKAMRSRGTSAANSSRPLPKIASMSKRHSMMWYGCSEGRGCKRHSEQLIHQEKAHEWARAREACAIALVELIEMTTSRPGRTNV